MDVKFLSASQTHETLIMLIESCEPMHGDAWWRHPQPRNVAETEIWLGRTALLDAIYYTPS